MANTGTARSNTPWHSPSPGQAVVLSGAITSRIEVVNVYRYHVDLLVDGKLHQLRAGTPLSFAPLPDTARIGPAAAVPMITLDLADINGRQARIAFTAPADVQIMREELQQRHTVRRGRSGDYECTCGATWDYRDGVEHP